MATSNKAITARASSNSSRINLLVVVVMALLAMSCCLGACKPDRTRYSEFSTLDGQGWYASMPLRFTPELSDSSNLLCDVAVAVRHNTSYPYRNLNLVVDFVDSTYTVRRHNVTIDVAGEKGEWRGTGFGRLYQLKVPVAHGVAPSQLHSVVVWQAMKGVDKVTNVENVGIIITPVKK